MQFLISKIEKQAKYIFCVSFGNNTYLLFKICKIFVRLRDVSLEKAVPAAAGQRPTAHGIELCACPPEYSGLSCQVRFHMTNRLCRVMFRFFKCVR